MRRPTASLHDVVRIEWRDAIGDDSWSNDILSVLPLCYTYGYLIKETEEFVVLAQTHETSGTMKEWAGQMLIPRGIISKIVVLKEASE